MTITQDQLLNATTAEAMAKLMADADEQSEPKGETTPEPTPPVDAAAKEPAAVGAAPDANSEEVHGVLTKSGSGVLPYTVLKEARDHAKLNRSRAEAAEQRAAELQEQLDALRRAGGTQQEQAAALAEFSDEEIDAAAMDYPVVAKMAAAIKDLRNRMSQAPAPSPEAQQDAEDERAAAANAALAGKTLLLKARAAGGALWTRACEIDAQLRADASFMQMPAAERFGEVQKRLAAEIGVAIPSAPAPQPPAAPAPSAPAAPPEIEPFRPNTTSDLLGGRTPEGDGISENANGMAMAARFATMTPAQVDAYIRRS